MTCVGVCPETTAESSRAATVAEPSPHAVIATKATVPSDRRSPIRRALLVALLAVVGTTVVRNFVVVWALRALGNVCGESRASKCEDAKLSELCPETWPRPGFDGSFWPVDSDPPSQSSNTRADGVGSRGRSTDGLATNGLCSFSLRERKRSEPIGFQHRPPQRQTEGE
jgi:hypothetical protein